jgi:transcriptional regulator of acetoin/glycerol metabolism
VIARGVAIHHRGDEAKAGEFKNWGIWLGGVWSKKSEGTNGISTCIAEQRPVLLHAGQHFRRRHTAEETAEVARRFSSHIDA